MGMFDWEAFPEGRARFSGGVRGVDEAGHETFAVEHAGRVRYGGIRARFHANRSDFDIEVFDVGHLDRGLAGMPMDPRSALIATFDAGELAAIRRLVTRLVERRAGTSAVPPTLEEHRGSRFMRTIHFVDGWALARPTGSGADARRAEAATPSRARIRPYRIEPARACRMTIDPGGGPPSHGVAREGPDAWIDLPEGRARFSGTVRGLDGTTHDTFQVRRDARTCSGGIRPVPRRHGDGHDLAIHGFGHIAADHVGMPMDPWSDRIDRFAPDDLRSIRSLIAGLVATKAGAADAAAFLGKTPHSEFRGGIEFVRGWALVRRRSGMLAVVWDSVMRALEPHLPGSSTRRWIR